MPLASRPSIRFVTLQAILDLVGGPLDGIAWTKLTLTGDTSAAAAGQATTFLMRDGNLFIGKSGTWFGSAQTSRDGE